MNADRIGGATCAGRATHSYTKPQDTFSRSLGAPLDQLLPRNVNYRAGGAMALRDAAALCTVKLDLSKAKALTAPPSPEHCGPSKRSYLSITPSTSPNSRSATSVTTTTLKAPWLSSALSDPEQGYDSIARSRTETLARQRDASLFKCLSTHPVRLADSHLRGLTKPPKVAAVELPSLRHLQLLPGPEQQEHAKMYPDTAEHTALWKRNLVHWCQQTTYENYAKIIQDVSSPLAALRPGLPLRHDNLSRLTSVLEPQDQFHELSNKPWNTSAPVTPPMSPQRDNELSDTYSTHRQFEQSQHTNPWTLTPQTIDSPYHCLPDSPRTRSQTESKERKTNANQETLFNPFISQKMILTVKESLRKVKEKCLVNKNRAGSSVSHRKTNSFKALQLKRLLDNRDVLSSDSRPNSESRKIRNQSSVMNHSDSEPRPSPEESSEASHFDDNSPEPENSNSPLKSIIPTITNTHEYIATTPVRVALSSARGATTPQKYMFKENSTRKPLQTDTAYQNNSYTRDKNVKTAKSVTDIDASNSPRYQNFTLESPPRKTTNHGSHKRNRDDSDSMSPTSPNTRKRRRSSEEKPHNLHPKRCVSCLSMDSPCWRPSWTNRKQDQLCNSCGLRFKKTRTRCLNDHCRKIPTKGELTIMKSNGEVKHYIAEKGTTIEGYKCLFCDSMTETVP